MKRRILSLVLIFIMLFCAGCQSRDKKEKTAARTEDLDEATLEGMSEDITKDLSLETKIGQLFMVPLYSLDEGDTKNQQKITSQMKKTMKQYKTGGVVLFSKNMTDAGQTKELISGLQDASRIPLFVSVDEEGGSVARVSSNEKMGVTHYPAAREIGDRSFGSDAGDVSDIISTLVTSMQKQQISAVLKHFPGSGETWGDTHRGSAEAEQTIQTLRKIDFKPFEAGIDADVDAVMVSHLMLSNVTDEREPSTLSKRVVTDILRNELEFDGVVMTDAMNMKAITDDYSAGEAAVKALQAGVDVVLMPDDLAEAYKAVKKAVDNGEIKESRIDESVERIIYTKLKRGVIPPDTDLLKDNG